MNWQSICNGKGILTTDLAQHFILMRMNRMLYTMYKYGYTSHSGACCHLVHPYKTQPQAGKKSTTIWLL